MKQNHLLSVRNVTVMAMFGALAAVLMIFEVPLPFIAPSFYGMDISEVPVLVGTFALGPVAGVVMELVKILVKLILSLPARDLWGSLPIFALDAPLCCRPVLFTGLKRRKRGLSWEWLREL